MKFIKIKFAKYPNLYGDMLSIEGILRKNYNIECHNKFMDILAKYSKPISDLTISNISKKNKYGCVIIEDREHLSLEILLRYMIIKMGKDYSYHVIGFKKNETFLKQNIPKIHPNINIHILDHYEIIDINHYNDIILSLDLWNIFDNEKILLFQSDSFLFNSKDIKHYFKFDYIGALWPHFPNNCYNGNGGFSIRSVKLMKEIINIKKHQKNMNIPEDLYIATIISQNNFSNYCFPSIYECSKFSIENFVVNKNTLIGGHQFWFCLENWEDYVNQAIISIL